jgi:hypothetical protein
MQITKERLKQIIREEMEVTLTNEEAGELFGEEVEQQLDEVDMSSMVDPQLMEIVAGLFKMGVNIGLPLVIAALSRMGYEGIASALSQEPMARKDKNFLMNYIQQELEGYKEFDK